MRYKNTQQVHTAFRCILDQYSFSSTVLHTSKDKIRNPLKKILNPKVESTMVTAEKASILYISEVVWHSMS